MSRVCGLKRKIHTDGDCRVVFARRCLLLGVSSVLVGLTGCGSGGDSLDRQAVKGSVLREGQPIDSGNLMFEPTGGGPGSTASISDGKYEISADSGPIPGSYNVKITQSLRKKEDPNLPKKDWETIPEDRFKGKQPPGGWTVKVDVKKGQVEPIDLKVGE